MPVVGDLDQARAGAQAEKYQVPTSGGSDAVLSHPDVELVVNLTIPAVHAQVSSQAIAAGKHVWSEKPISVDGESGRALLDHADKAGVLLGVAPDTVLGPGIQSVRQAIARGDIGEPLSTQTVMQYPGPDIFHPNPDFLFLQRGCPGRHRHPDAQLTNLACFGDDTTAMLTGNGSTCSYPQGSQLAAALASLRQGVGVGLVTITIGVNDLYGCTVVGIDGTCVAYVTRTMGAALTSMLAQIRAAAPLALIVALTYYNPLLATSLGTPEAPSTVAPRAADPQVATDSAQAFAGLNRVITTAVTAVGGRVADIAAAFAVTDTSGSPLPVNIQRLCDWTSLCTRGDAHPNDAGYAAMARAVSAVL